MGDFNKFIFIVGFIWSGYYLLVIFFDLLKSASRVAEVNTHHVEFESEKPVLINDESAFSNHFDYTEVSSYSDKEYLPKDSTIDFNPNERKKSLMVDLGLETISGEAYEVSAENLSKYMKV